MPAAPSCGLLTSETEFRDLTGRLLAEGAPVAFDIETGYDGQSRPKAGLHPEENFIAGVSFTNSLSWARYVPVNHESGTNMDPGLVAQQLWPLAAAGLLVAHGGKFELRCTSRLFHEHVPEAAPTKGYFPLRSCTMLEAHAEGKHRTVALKALTLATFGHKMTELLELYPDGLTKAEEDSIRFSVLDQHDPKVVSYACEDSIYSLANHLKRYPQLSQPSHPQNFIYRTEMALLPIVCAMEETGVRYDWAFMREAAQRGRAFQDRMAAEITTDLAEMLGEPVRLNLASPKQVADVLFTRLRLPSKRRSKKTGAPSTDKIALKGLLKTYPVVKKLVGWKQIAKLCGTYLEVYEKKFAYAPDGVTHPNHLQHGVPAGRFAVSDPPYQQCLPGDYEVLTIDGWTRLDVLRDGDEVIQYRPDGQMEFVVPAQVTRQPYAGEMVELRSAEGGTWQYTPNHRIVYRKRRGPGPSPVMEMTAAAWEDALLARPLTEQGRRLSDYRMVKAGYVAGGWSPEGVDLTLLRLAVACQADGNRRTDGPAGQVWYDVELHTERKQQRFAELAGQVDHIRNYFQGNVGVREVASTRSRRWRVEGPLVAGWLDEGKNFRPHAVLSLSAGSLREFLDEVMAWDGDFTRRSTFGQKTTRRQSVDVVQAAAALCGYATSLYERPEFDAVTVNLWDRLEKDPGWQEPVRVPSPGAVYCVTVPSGMFLARNPQGKVQVTGNSPKKYHFELADGETFEFNFRNGIVTPPGYYGLGFDYSQIELRVIAGEAGETALLEAFARGEDVHSLTAALMLGIPLADVDDDKRAIGKMLNFALAYQMGEDGLADRLGISLETAQELFAIYFSIYSKIKRWIDATVATAARQGYVITKFGRRVPVWQYERPERYIRAQGDRLAGNAPIQGGAADYVKVAMVRADKALRAAGLLARGVRLSMNIHDALEWLVPEDIPPAEVMAALTSPGVIGPHPALFFPVPGWPPMEAEWHRWAKWGSPTKLALDGSEIQKDEPELPVMVGEEDEEGPSLPQVDLTVLTAAQEPAPEPAPAPAPAPPPAPPAPDGPPRTVIVQVPHAPDLTAFTAVMEFVGGRPGHNTVLLRCPHGDVPLGDSGVTQDDEPAFALAIPGATVFYDAGSVDYQQVAEGLSL